MQLIPVIDLQDGQVVHALRGERRLYRPLRSRLLDGCAPIAVAQALLAVTGSATLYVADLDAIVRGQTDVSTLQALLAALPDTTLWLDAGFADRAAADALLARVNGGARLRPVFGSESLRDLGPLGADAILSLDRHGAAPLDPAGVFADSTSWPTTVIAMDLARVGSDLGPDTAAIEALRAQVPAAQVVGAGSLRDLADVARARASGATAWLVASALHDGRLGVGRPA